MLVSRVPTYTARGAVGPGRDGLSGESVRDHDALLIDVCPTPTRVT